MIANLKVKIDPELIGCLANESFCDKKSIDEIVQWALMEMYCYDYCWECDGISTNIISFHKNFPPQQLCLKCLAGVIYGCQIDVTGSMISAVFNNFAILDLFFEAYFAAHQEVA